MAKPRKVIAPHGRVTWEVRLREGGRGSKALKRRFSTARDAEVFVEEIAADRRKIEQGPSDVGSFRETTFQKEADNWLADIRLRCSASHCERVRGQLADFNLTYGSLEPSRITLEFMSVLQKRLKERRSGRVGRWTNSTVNLYTGTICAVLNFSARQRRIPYSPVLGFRKLPKNSRETAFWDEREAGSFLNWCNERFTDYDNRNLKRARKYYVLYLLALNTGMRAGEIWGLQPQDFRFGEAGLGDTILVRRQRDRLTGNLGPLKGELRVSKDKSRHVPCPPGLRKELEGLVDFNSICSHEPVFQSPLGNPIQHDRFAHRFRRDLTRWGGRPIRFHDLRHTAATLMLNKGVDLKSVKEILGHEDVSTTMRYIHLVGDRIRRVSQAFSIQPVDASGVGKSSMGSGVNTFSLL